MKNAKRRERQRLKNLEKPWFKKQRGQMPPPTRVKKPKRGKGSYNRQQWRKEDYGSIEKQ
jgi:hypothetical protein